MITLLNLTDIDPDRDSPGAPVLASVSKGVPGIFMDCHMMVSQPEKVSGHLFLPGSLNLTLAVMSG